MSSLQRYRKPGGFNQLLNLLEGFGPQKREKFLEMIAAENSNWANALREKMLTFEKVNRWPDEVILEVMKTLPEKLMVCMLHAFDEARRETLVTLFPASEKRRMSVVMSEGAPNNDEINLGLAKFLELARRMINDKILKVEKFAPDLMLPPEIESKLDSGASLSAAVAAEAPSMDEPASGQVVDLGQHRSELEKLKRRLTEVTNENKALKEDVQTLRTKLDQIRKIA